jgi:hypothetical protein
MSAVVSGSPSSSVPCLKKAIVYSYWSRLVICFPVPRATHWRHGETFSRFVQGPAEKKTDVFTQIYY